MVLWANDVCKHDLPSEPNLVNTRRDQRSRNALARQFMTHLYCTQIRNAHNSHIYTLVWHTMHTLSEKPHDAIGVVVRAIRSMERSIIARRCFMMLSIMMYRSTTCRY